MTSSITGAAFASLITTTSNQLGAQLPDALQDALDLARHVREQAAQIEGSAAAANARIIGHLQAGTQWRTDKAVQALLFERVAADIGIRTAGVDACEEMIRDAVTAHAEAIVAAWADALAPNVKALTAAAGKLELDTLETADVAALTRRGLVTVWADARLAVERLDIMASGWGVVAAAIRLNYNREYQPFVLTGTPAILDRVEPAAGSWGLVRAGAVVEIAGPTEYTRRVQAHEATLHKRRAAEEEQRRNARKAVLRG